MTSELKVGDLVKRQIASIYTKGKRSDAVGVILKLTEGSLGAMLAKVYFYDTNKNEVWNCKVLEKVERRDVIERAATKGVGDESR
tara:strand:+ start:155 stop:409 length:255 start_codon:yes stop_codon:yes gene_type:complete